MVLHFLRDSGYRLHYVYFVAFQIEDLIQVAGKQLSSIREKMAFLVILYTLVQSIEELSEPHHLQTALNVYSLLEARIRKLITKGISMVSGSNKKNSDRDAS